ncbi:MAG: four helix bundle protein [Myxococcales bacterium]|nr:four helix bundle protein [Myxococcales bacterium]
MNHTLRITALDMMMATMPSLRVLLGKIATHDRNLEDQMRRAATSVISNHAEADGVRKGHRREKIQTAQGSLSELRAQLKLAEAWGYVSTEEAKQLDTHLDKVAALTWRRLHPKR